MCLFYCIKQIFLLRNFVITIFFFLLVRLTHYWAYESIIVLAMCCSHIKLRLMFKCFLWRKTLPSLKEIKLLETRAVHGRVGLGLELTCTLSDWVGWLRIGPILDWTNRLDLAGWAGWNPLFGGSWLQIRQKNESNKWSIKYKLDKQNKKVLGFQFFKVWVSVF